jgi:hypothetical protein
MQVAGSLGQALAGFLDLGTTFALTPSPHAARRRVDAQDWIAL